MNRLRDQVILDNSSNFFICNVRILAILDKNCIKDYAMKTVVVPVDSNENENYEGPLVKAKCMILDEVKDHVKPHIVDKNTINEMRQTLTTLYYGSSV